MLKKVILIAGLITVLSCNQPNDEQYELSIQEWHQLRIDSLKGKTGFINLAGLYWLKDGINTFGSDNSNDLHFTDKSNSILGSFLLEDTVVYLITQNEIFIDGKVVSDTTVVFENGKTKYMKFKSLFWFIIKRGDQIGVRLRDFDYYLLEKFNSIDYFETDPDWKIEATWESYKNPIVTTFSNVVGMTMQYSIKGAFHFNVGGQEYKLEPLGDPEPDGYFVMFYDKTSGHSTYGSGRYIYVSEPDSLGNTFIDFNKAYNPPCAFTEFATCLFPHKENRLSLFVNAGEKFSEH